MGKTSFKTGADSLALARTQWAVAQLGQYLQIDLSDENQRQAFIAQALSSLEADKHDSAPPLETRGAASPPIIPHHVQKALKTYREIETF